MFNCGGNYNNSSNAGVFYANGNNARTNTNTNISFRAAYPIVRYCTPMGCNQHKGIRDLTLSLARTGVEMFSCVNRFRC